MDVGSSDREQTNAAVRAIVGSGGETIRELEAQSGAAIAVERSGSVRIEAPDATSAEAARAAISKIVEPMLRRGASNRGGSGGGGGYDGGGGNGKSKEEDGPPRPRAPPPELVPGMDPAKQAAMKRNAKRRDAKRARKHQQQQEQQQQQHHHQEEQQQQQQQQQQQEADDGAVNASVSAHDPHSHEGSGEGSAEQPQRDDEESWLQGELAAAGLRFGAAADDETADADLDDVHASALTGESPSMLSAASEVYDEMSGSMSRTVLDLLGLGVQRG